MTDKRKRRIRNVAGSLGKSHRGAANVLASAAGPDMARLARTLLDVGPRATRIPDLQVVAPLGTTVLPDIFAHYESRSLNVRRILFHPHDFSDIRKFTGDVFDLVTHQEVMYRGLRGMLWAADMILDTRVPPGTLLIQALDGHAWGVVNVVGARRDWPTEHGPLPPSLPPILGIDDPATVARAPDLAVSAPITPPVLADWFAVLEVHGVVNTIAVHPLDAAYFRKFARDVIDINTDRESLLKGHLGAVWGAYIMVTRDVPEGTPLAVVKDGGGTQTVGRLVVVNNYYAGAV